jgi:hypothetical protein
VSLGSENWDVFLGYFGLVGLSYIIILSIRGEWWAQTSLTIVVLTLIFATKGGIGNIIHAGLTDAIRAQARYSQYICGMYLYYTPSMMESISALLKPFIDTSINHSITMYSKADSPAHLKQLFEPVS